MSNWTSAPAVSAKLRKAGFGIVTTRNREGIRVSRGSDEGSVRVSVDLDRPGEEARIADALAEHLATWSGYAVTRNSSSFTVTREA